MWAGGQRSPLKPDLGRNPHHGPFLGQESPSTLHNLPRAKPHTPPAQPPKPCRLLSCMHLFQTGQVEKNWPQAMPGTHQNGPNQLHPTTTAVHAFPTVRVPAGPHRMSRPGFQDLFLGRPYLQAEGRVHLVSPPCPAPRQCRTGRCQRPGSTCRHWAAKPPSSSGGF